MSLPPHAADWMNRAEIDYIGPFVKAWAAFNAWYRHASSESKERAMLEYVKRKPNAVRRRVLPLLKNDNETGDALTLKKAIYDLHQRLDDNHFEVTRKGVNEQISFRKVCIFPKPLNQKRLEYWKHEFKVVKVQRGGIEITVTSLRNNRVKLQHTQDQYDSNEVYELPDFTENLSESLRTKFRLFYDDCNPRPMEDLVQGGGPVSLTVAAMQFQCTEEHLLFGLVEIIYAMRNALLHGEVDPNPEVLACYEPAYRIVMQFLACV